MTKSRKPKNSLASVDLLDDLQAAGRLLRKTAGDLKADYRRQPATVKKKLKKGAAVAGLAAAGLAGAMMLGKALGNGRKKKKR